MQNPYSGATFFSFFGVLAKRLWHCATGQLEGALASDELQLLVLIGIALSCSLVGLFLVLRKMTMLANSLSHTLILGIVAVFFFLSAQGETPTLLPLPALLGAAFIAALLTCVITAFFTTVLKLEESASIALVFTTLFALGVLLITLYAKNSHLAAELVMGNVDALQRGDLKAVWIAFFANSLLITLFFKELKVSTFDGGFARSQGISPTLFNYLLMGQTAFTATAAFRAVGVLMGLAFFVAPPLIARLFTHRLSTLLKLGLLIGVAASLGGVALSRHILSMTGRGVSTGGLVVSLLFISYFALVPLSRISIRRLTFTK